MECSQIKGTSVFQSSETSDFLQAIWFKNFYISWSLNQFYLKAAYFCQSIIGYYPIISDLATEAKVCLYGATLTSILQYRQAFASVARSLMMGYRPHRNTLLSREIGSNFENCG